MPTWDAQQYLRFSEQRTRPCRELVSRVMVDRPRQVIDLGCGPGNSTAVLAGRWPEASIVGLDSSPEMIAEARRAAPDRAWLVGNIAAWADKPGPFDVVFSNAAMQWVENHETAFPTLLGRVAQGGALAVQMPGNFDAPAHSLMRELAASPQWRDRFGRTVREWHVHDLTFYYDVLSPLATTVDLWETEYLHIFPDAESIVEWYKGTGLRPFLDAQSGEEERKAFVQAYLGRIKSAYPTRPDGRVIFPFRRLFIIAYQAQI